MRLNEDRFMFLLCHILTDSENHPLLVPVPASTAASVQDLNQSFMGKDKNKNLDNNVTILGYLGKGATATATATGLEFVSSTKRLSNSAHFQ